MENFIIDIALVAVLVLSAVLAARKGFFLSLMSLVSSVAALIGARIFSNPVAVFVYDTIVRNPVLAKVQSLLPASLEGNDPAAVLDGMLEQLPEGVVTLADNYGLLDSVRNATGDAAAFFNIENLEINYVKPFCLSVLSVVAMVCVFFVLFVVLRLLSKLLNNVIYRKKKQPVNRFLGATLGVLRAIIPIAIFVILLNLAADYGINDTLTAAVENSKICAWVGELLPQIYSGITEGITNAQVN